MRFSSLLILVALVGSVACSSGAGSDSDSVVGDGGGSQTPITFAPADTNPGADTVSMSSESLTPDTANLAVNLTGTNGVYGATFDLIYDGSAVRFQSWSPGTALEAGNHAVNYVVDEPVAGRLVVSVSRVGNVPEANVTGTRPLLRLRFAATQAGDATLRFQSAALLDGQPASLPSISWGGGTVSVP